MPLYETHLQSEESPGMIFVKETCLSKVIFLNSVEERRAHGITRVHLVSQFNTFE